MSRIVSLRGRFILLYTARKLGKESLYIIENVIIEKMGHTETSAYKRVIREASTRFNEEHIRVFGNAPPPPWPPRSSNGVETQK